jgi:hypothetical protein
MRGIASPHHVDDANARADQVGHRMFGWDRAPGADLENSRVVLLFRFDHLETDGSPVWQNRVYADARGDTAGRPIHVSVARLLGSAAKSDHWLVRPGTGHDRRGDRARDLENRWRIDGFSMNTDWAAAGRSATRLPAAA